MRKEDRSAENAETKVPSKRPYVAPQIRDLSQEVTVFGTDETRGTRRAPPKS